MLKKRMKSVDPTESLQNATICTWFYAESEGEESYYPQVGGVSSSCKFHAIYLRCAIVFFASSLRQNPTAKHVLFTNLTVFPKIDGVDINALLSRWRVDVVSLPLTHLTPEGYHTAWRNQFYIFDILHYLAQRCGDIEQYYVLDSDCVWIKPVTTIQPALHKYSLLTYDLSGCRSKPNAEGLKSLYAKLGHPPHSDDVMYYGGECFVANGQALKQVYQAFPAVWKVCLDRFTTGHSYFLEEAYTLSYLYHQLGYQGGTANTYIKRMWTAGKYVKKNVIDTDYNLTIWHLPDEKKAGLRELFYQVINPQSKFWHLPTGHPLTVYLGRYLGVPQGNWRRQLWALRNRQIRNFEKIYQKVQKVLPILPNYVSGF